MSFNTTFIANFSDSDDEHYKAELARRCAEIEALLQEQEEKEWLEYQAQKEAKIMERKRLEKEAYRKQEEEEENAWQKEEECQRNLAHYLEVDYITAVEQQQHKNWVKNFLPSSSPPSDEEMNLIDLPCLTKRQRVCYLPKETLEACQ